MGTATNTDAVTRPVAADPSATPERMAWVDIAKAVAIFLVVVYHAGRVTLPIISPHASGPAVEVWHELNKVLLPVRMPLFFLVSGLLAAHAVRRPWPRVLRRKVLNLIWPYVLWTLAFGVTWTLAVFPDDSRSWFAYNLRMLPFGGLAYWYLSLLAVFFVVAKLLRRQAVLLMIASVTLLALAPLIGSWAGSGSTQSLTANVDRFCYFAAWFVVGCFGSGVIKRIVSRRPAWAAALLAAVAYGILAYIQYHTDLTTPVLPYLGPLGVAAALFAAVAVSRFAAVRRAGAYLARRTLPIYVLHPILMHLAILAARATGFDPLATIGSPIADFLFVPVLAIVCTLIAVAGYDLAQRIHLSWLFEWPRSRPAGAAPQRADSAASTSAPT